MNLIVTLPRRIAIFAILPDIHYIKKKWNGIGTACDQRGVSWNIGVHMAMCEREHCKIKTKCCNREAGFQFIIVVSSISCNLNIVSLTSAYNNLQGWLC